MPNPLHSKKYKLVIEKLKQARIDVNLTQVEVAQKLNKPQSYVSKIENGERRIDVAELMELAKIYNKNLSFFTES